MVVGGCGWLWVVAYVVSKTLLLILTQKKWLLFHVLRKYNSVNLMI